MGNLLESDASSESDTENKSRLKLEHGLVRTEGDGMECDETKSFSSSGTNSSDILLTKEVEVKSSNPPPIFQKTASLSSFDVSKKCATESPRCLPPRDQLIPLRPKSSTGSVSEKLNQILPMGSKQRDPKFVPYEPYKGAVRSMTDNRGIKAQMKKIQLELEGPSNMNFPQLKEAQEGLLTLNLQRTMVKSPHRVPSNKLEIEQDHSTTLLKERLKMSERDIKEIQAENVRLKKLLVDSLAGAGPLVLADEIRRASLNIKCQGANDSVGINAHSINESFDNLSDEIEVWRSKFLSSCVLVDKLTKDNHNLTIELTDAFNLFKEVKNSTQLTPKLFDEINRWIKSQNVSYKMTSTSPLEEEDNEGSENYYYNN